MKRKMIAALLTAVMTCSMSATAFAAQATTGTLEKTKGTEVKYEVAEKYEISIPETITFTNSAQTPSQEISVTGALINNGNELSVKVSSADYVNSFKMKTSAKDELEYQIKVGEGSEAIENNAVVLSVQSGQTEKSVILNYSVPTPPKAAGIYTDTLTFTSSIQAKAGV